MNKGYDRIRKWASLFGVVLFSFAAAEEKQFRIQGEVPEGWEVVESTNGPLIEKWVELKTGEKKKLMLRSFVLQPVAESESKISVINPLELSDGQKLDDVLTNQNENLAQTQGELELMLRRLKALLSTLPNPTTTNQS